MSNGLIVINDTHTDESRKAGATAESNLALRKEILLQLSTLVLNASYQKRDLLHNGDLFSTTLVPNTVLSEVFVILADFCGRAKAYGGVLYLCRGNHDAHKNSAEFSSFDLLAELLRHQFDNVVICKEPTSIPYGLVIPHMMNQGLFDEVLHAAESHAGGTLFLHCNVNNNFAAKSDHSLNITSEQISRLTNFDNIVIGHEHQKRRFGKTYITGNQYPVSVADCLGNDEKFYAEIVDGKVNLVKTVNIVDLYLDINITELLNGFVVPDNIKFLRVSGELDKAEATAMVTAIAKLRKTHTAFVIANAVKVIDDTVEEVQPVSHDKFSLKEALRNLLTDKEFSKVETLC